MVKSIGVCSWSLQPNDPVHLARSISKCGLHRTQLALDPLSSGDWDLESLNHAFSSSKISICSGMITTVGEDYSSLESIKATGGVRPDQHWETNQQRARFAAVMGELLELSLVTFHAGFIPSRGTSEYRVMTDRIKTIADIFFAHGISLALETGQERAESLLEMLAEPSMSSIGVNFDPANMILYGMDNPANAFELLKEHIVQVHMKDAIATQTLGEWGSEVPAGEGEVDWDHFFQAVHGIPRSIDVIIEREAGNVRVNDIVKARTITATHGFSHD